MSHFLLFYCKITSSKNVVTFFKKFYIIFYKIKYFSKNIYYKNKTVYNKKMEKN